MALSLTENALIELAATVRQFEQQVALRPTHILVPWRNAKRYWRATMTKRRWRRLRGKLKARGL